MDYVPKKFADFKMGDTNIYTHTISEDDVKTFARITGDHNPLHLDEAYAQTTPFKGRVVHGMLVESIMSGGGSRFMGMGAIHVGHSAKFTAPTRIGDTVTVTSEIVDLMPEKRRLTIKCVCTNQDGVAVAESETVVKLQQ